MTPLSEKGFKILNRMNRKMPDYLSPVWQGFDEPTTDECLLGENFSIYLNPKHLGIGAGVGGLVGLSYGYWDYNDAKKQAAKKGLQKPDKKKILIRDTLIGMGLGTVASPLATMLLKTLENKRVSQSQKDTFDKLELDILKGNDKPKLLALLNNYKNDITPEQYNTLKTLVDATSEKKFNEPKINKPPVREMPYNEKIARIRDSLPSPINDKGEIDLEAVKKIQSKLSPYESSQFLQKFGVKMKDVVAKEKQQQNPFWRDNIEKAAEIAKQKVTPEQQEAIRNEKLIEVKEEPKVKEKIVVKPSKAQIKKVEKEIQKSHEEYVKENGDGPIALYNQAGESVGYEIDGIRHNNDNKPLLQGNYYDIEGNLIPFKPKMIGTPKPRKSGGKKSRKNKNFSDNLTDVLFSYYFSNKAQIFRNYNAQKKRGF